MNFDLEEAVEVVVESVVDAALLLKYPKEWITVKLLTSYPKAIVVGGMVLCLSPAMYGEPSFAAPCDTAIVEKRMIATSTSASPVADMAKVFWSYKRTGQMFELS